MSYPRRSGQLGDPGSKSPPPRVTLAGSFGDSVLPCEGGELKNERERVCGAE